MIQILNGLRYLHVEQQVAHRDLKLDNVLVRKEADGQLVALISDFGFAIKSTKSKEIKQNQTQLSSVSLEASEKSGTCSLLDL